ncbi:unnamed protein product [Mytilus coruscus]|uniref:XK-related protein n=1 Tax=Mytilus coruscus TaxID=42192 RepID=A0A6J8CWV8_MYTCO|nr:unnamed protein product [Mytilus coruscus]
MAIMTTASNMNSTTARYYLNCTQTVSSIMNDTITTPFWISNTTMTSEFIRYVSITASSLGLAWSLNAFKHQYRKTEQNQEDSVLIKVIHWISRVAEIGPRIILLALITAEYSYLVSIFIIYRLLHGLMYVCSKEDIGLDLFLGTFGNIFCFSVSQIYQCHKKEQCGGIFFGFYYALYYAENAAMLFFWYSDDPELLHYKIGGACSNHAAYAPYIFGIVCVGCVFQLSFLRLYYWRRKKQQTANLTNTSDMSE